MKNRYDNDFVLYKYKLYLVVGMYIYLCKFNYYNDIKIKFWSRFYILLIDFFLCKLFKLYIM